MEIEKIIRTKRRTVSIQITDQATIIVRAPLRASIDRIMQIVEKHKKWIDKKREEIQNRHPILIPKKFVDGEKFLFLGHYYPLKIVDNQEVGLKFDTQFYLLKDAKTEGRLLFTNWYKSSAYKIIGKQLNTYAQINGFRYDRFRITNAQTRWGSCSKRNINFSWRLVMAPISVVNYVIVHELVHIDEKNHSKKFWDKVKNIMPDFKIHRDWLRKNGYLLRL